MSIAAPVNKTVQATKNPNQTKPALVQPNTTSLVNQPDQKNKTQTLAEPAKNATALAKDEKNKTSLIESKPPSNELEGVSQQISQLQEIKVIAQKLKELREERDAEKKIFDEEVTKLSAIRSKINERKEELKRMYQKASISIPKMS